MPTVTNIDSFIEVDDSKMSWSRDLKNDLRRGRICRYNDESIRPSLYRPFVRQSLYFDRVMNEEVYGNPRIFPLTSTENIIICVSGVGSSKPFHFLASNVIPCFDLLEKTQGFPLCLFDEDGANRRDNITDWGLNQFQERYSDSSITKQDVFHYVYGILHDPVYRSKYAANLKRELPRIPLANDFWKVAGIGKQLMDLHVNYEDQPEYPLEEVWTVPKGYRTEYGQEVTRLDQVPLRERYRVTKMKRNKKDPTQLIVNEFLTLTGIPPNVDDYKLGNRSALEWVVDQYQVSTDKRSGITNDPNCDDDPEYIVRIVAKVLHVSLATIRQIDVLTV